MSRHEILCRELTKAAATDRSKAAMALLVELFPGEGSLIPLSVESHEEDAVILSTGSGSGALQGTLPVDVLIAHSGSETLAREIVVRTLLDGVCRLPDHRETRYPLERPETIRKSLEGTVPTDRRDKVLSMIRAGSSIALVGKSASGKTVCAGQVATLLVDDGWSLSWLDLSNPNHDVIDLALSLLEQVGSESDGAHLIVVDDCQANPSAMRAIGNMLGALSPEARTPVRLLLAGWESTQSILVGLFAEVRVVACHGDGVLPQIVAELSPGRTKKEINRLVSISQGDLWVAKLLLKMGDLSVQSDELVGKLAEEALRLVTDGAELSIRCSQLLYRLASLTQFEIDASYRYANDIDRASLEELITRRIVRRTGTFVSVGHRSLGRLLALHLEPDFRTELGNPGEISVNYLREATSPQQLFAVLERLDLASMERETSDLSGTTFLARAWDSFGLLLQHVVSRVTQDPSWSDNLGCAVFAAQALTSVDRVEWSGIADYLRRRWIIEGSQLIVSGDPTSEHEDFFQIQKAMREEEATVRYPDDQRAEILDPDRMHRNWALGLLLGFEARVPEGDPQRLDGLKAVAEAEQLPSGAFYPERVPWVTARILLGLSSAGEAVGTSRVVRDACRWLRTPPPEGPYHYGCWQSGTGRWNTKLSVTAMCVNALLECGVPLRDRSVQTGLSYLQENRDQWLLPGNEIDGAQAIETVFQATGQWRDIREELFGLLDWVRASESWETAGMSARELQDESCKVPQVASTIVSIVWATVRAEIPLLLEGLSLRLSSGDNADTGYYDLSAVRRAQGELESELNNRIAARRGHVVNGGKKPKMRQALKDLRNVQNEVEELGLRLAMNSLEARDVGEIARDLIKLGEGVMDREWVKEMDRLGDIT